MTTANFLKISGSKWNMETKNEIERVTIAKEIMIPSVIPIDFDRLPPTADEESIIGSNGQIHGARMVKRPDMKANASKIIIKPH